MLSISYLLELIDAFKLAAGLRKDTTLSFRMFGDSAKIERLRTGADITTRRFNSALRWLDAHWPEGEDKPASLADLLATGADTSDTDVDLSA